MTGCFRGAIRSCTKSLPASSNKFWPVSGLEELLQIMDCSTAVLHPAQTALSTERVRPTRGKTVWSLLAPAGSKPMRRNRQEPCLCSCLEPDFRGHLTNVQVVILVYH